MSSTMQAVVKAKSAPGVEIQEVPRPAFGPADVLVKVEAASVCGTDLHIYNWDPWAQGRIHPPLIPGHEFCGAVAAVGNQVTTVREGDFVSADMHVAAASASNAAPDRRTSASTSKSSASMRMVHSPNTSSSPKPTSGSSTHRSRVNTALSSTL